MYSISTDLHTHTIASGHAVDTIRIMSEYACRQGLEGIAITDHGPGLPDGACAIYFRSLYRMTQGIDLPIRIFHGIEDDIKNRKGELALSEEILSNLEIVMAGIHPYTWMADQTLTVRTDAVINAMNNNFIKVFTHPVGTDYDIDIDAVISAANQNDIALELNESKLTERKIVIDYLDKCAKSSTSIVVNSDAHLAEEVGTFSEAESILKEISFPEPLIINRNKEAISSFFNIEW